MKKFRTISFLLGFCIIFSTSDAQERDIIRFFLDKVENNLREVDSTTRIINYRKSLSDYKIITKGSLGKDNKSFKHVIKYDERGFKKEKLKIYQSTRDKKILVMYLVKINDKIHFLEYYDTERDSKNKIVKRSKEILIDNRIYQKIFYNNPGEIKGNENKVTFTLL